MSNAPQTLTITETHQLLNELLCKNGSHKQFRKGIRNYCIACLMIEAGLRVGEVVSLPVPRLWLNDQPAMAIYITSENSKNGTERIVPTSTRLREAIVQMSEFYWSESENQQIGFAFFSSDKAKPLTTRQVERIIGSAANRSIGRPVHPHVLRHTFATRLMRVTDIRTVQELLGHKRLTSTQVYTHPDYDDKKLAIDNLESQ